MYKVYTMYTKKRGEIFKMKLRKVSAEQAFELATKLIVQSDGIVFHEELKLPNYNLTIKEACLFAIITDCNFKQVFFNESDVIGKYGFENLSDVIIHINSLRKKGFIYYEKKLLKCGATQIIYCSKAFYCLKALSLYYAEKIQNKILNSNKPLTDTERELITNFVRVYRGILEGGEQK